MLGLSVTLEKNTGMMKCNPVKPGDLVRVKWSTLSGLRYMFRGPTDRTPLLVMERHLGAIKVLLPNGDVWTDMVDNFEIVSTC